MLLGATARPGEHHGQSDDRKPAEPQPLLEDGTLAIPILENYPIGDATDALQALATRHTQGKIAISIA